MGQASLTWTSYPGDTWTSLCFSWEHVGVSSGETEKANKPSPATQLFSPAQLIFPLVTGIKDSHHNAWTYYSLWTVQMKTTKYYFKSRNESPEGVENEQQNKTDRLQFILFKSQCSPKRKRSCSCPHPRCGTRWCYWNICANRLAWVNKLTADTKFYQQMLLYGHLQHITWYITLSQKGIPGKSVELGILKGRCSRLHLEYLSHGQRGWQLPIAIQKQTAFSFPSDISTSLRL